MKINRANKYLWLLETNISRRKRRKLPLKYFDGYIEKKLDMCKAMPLYVVELLLCKLNFYDRRKLEHW